MKYFNFIFGLLICFWNSYRLFNCEEIYYGIELLFHYFYYNALCYKTHIIEHNNSKMIKITSQDEFCFVDLDSCVEKAIELCQIENINRKLILLRIIYDLSHVFMYRPNEFLKLLLNNEKLSNDFYQLINLPTSEILSTHTLGLYQFLDKNFNIENGIVNDEIMIILYIYNFVIGFITPKPELYKDYYTTKLIFQNNHYNICTNDFTCNSPHELFALLLKKISQNKTESSNDESYLFPLPCLQKKAILILKLLPEQCICCHMEKNFSSYKFMGNFELNNCVNLINDILYDQNKIYGKEFSAYDFISNLNHTHTIKIKIHNQFIDAINRTYDSIIQTNLMYIKKYCKDLHSESIVHENDDLIIQCFQLVFMYTLLQNNYFKEHSFIFTATSENFYTHVKASAFIIGDSRFGIYREIKKSEYYIHKPTLQRNHSFPHVEYRIMIIKPLSHITLTVIPISGVLYSIILCLVYYFIKKKKLFKNKCVLKD